MLDRLGVHRKPEVREAIEARGCESVLLPGYGPDFDPIELAFRQDRGVREGCGGEDGGGRWTQRSRLRWGRCRWGMWWVGLSMLESRITHCENRCKEVGRVDKKRLQDRREAAQACRYREDRNMALGKPTRANEDS